MDGLKQRVIGALVLISLAVIFVPMLFDEPHTERSSRMIDIPEEPPFPEVQAPPKVDAEAPSYRLEEPSAPASEPTASPDRAQPAPEQLAGEAEPAAPESEPQPQAQSQTQTPAQTQTQTQTQASQEPAAPAAEPAPETEEFSRSLEGAWVVQLGSFGNADNARRLRDKVREKGYDSHLQRVEQGGTTFTRVFVGPYVDKAAAEKAKRELDAGFGLNGLVTAGE
ncbi:MAG: SPOR domain-containing protein [Marinobacter sp.]|uniref:SPOR domain-containing protein n=1 Tax=Marinobacter sp. TaxID=50741 RepID=UPI00299CDE92|nr:SPOR domain-containing protein [Marinobacter sp.]MDX1633124.1 SPOR domain-containing protein [Marinobacter sp.]